MFCKLWKKGRRRIAEKERRIAKRTVNGNSEIESRLEMKIKGKLMDGEGIGNTFRRLAHQVIERNDGVDNLVIIGIRTRGITVAKRIKKCLDSIEGSDIPLGVFDITLYRDDLEDLTSEIEFSGSEIDFPLDGKTVLLCDDVVYTGRTVRAAISEIMSMGRPAKIQLLTLIDRGHRELPFKADYIGKSVPTSKREGIAVRLDEEDGEDAVYIYDK